MSSRSDHIFSLSRWQRRLGYQGADAEPDLEYSVQPTTDVAHLVPRFQAPSAWWGGVAISPVLEHAALAFSSRSEGGTVLRNLTLVSTAGFFGGIVESVTWDTGPTAMEPQVMEAEFSGTGWLGSTLPANLPGGSVPQTWPYITAGVPFQLAELYIPSGQHFVVWTLLVNSQITGMWTAEELPAARG